MKVIITITSRAQADGEVQTATQQVNGFLRRAENSLELAYRESAGEEGLGNTLTSLRIFPGSLELSRQGDYRCRLLLEVGNRHAGDYHTPFGSVTLTTDTHALASTLTPEGHGELTVCYDLITGDQHTAHELHIVVKPCP